MTKKFICENCGNEFYDIPSKKRRFCSKECGGKRKKLKEEFGKIGLMVRNAWKRGCYEEAKKKGKYAVFTGKKHTEEHKRYMKELMTGREVTWNDKIKENHWSKNPIKRKETTEKLIQTRRKNKNWNSEERRYILANWCIDHPDKVGPKFYKRGKYRNRKNGTLEYYSSGFELTVMRKLDSDDNIVNWTKKHGIRILYMINGKKKIYIPDFLIDYKGGKKKLLESKGRVYDQNILEKKINAAQKYCIDNNIEFEIVYQK